VWAVLGDFRTLDQPKGHEPEVKSLLASGQDLRQSMLGLATGFRELDVKMKKINWRNPASTVDSVRDSLTTVRQLNPTVKAQSRTEVPAWNRNLHTLGIDGCLPSLGGYPDTLGAAPKPTEGLSSVPRLNAEPGGRERAVGAAVAWTLSGRSWVPRCVGGGGQTGCR
jgi:hypothetical protein